MLKRDLIKKLEDLPDDAYIVFAMFDWTAGKGHYWRLLNLTIPHQGDPANVIGLSSSHSGIYAESLEGMGAIGVKFNDTQEGGTL